jgi:hypothetical protein
LSPPDFGRRDGRRDAVAGARSVFRVCRECRDDRVVAAADVEGISAVIVAIVVFLLGVANCSC